MAALTLAGRDAIVTAAAARRRSIVPASSRPTPCRDGTRSPGHSSSRAYRSPGASSSTRRRPAACRSWSRTERAVSPRWCQNRPVPPEADSTRSTSTRWPTSWPGWRRFRSRPRRRWAGARAETVSHWGPGPIRPGCHGSPRTSRKHDVSPATATIVVADHESEMRP